MRMGGEVEEDDGDGGFVGLAEAADVVEDVAVALDDVFCAGVEFRIRIRRRAGKETHAKGSAEAGCRGR
jgi:hypothetical protein